MSVVPLDEFERLAARGETLRQRGPRGRYAPSPTGQLHLGNLRTALLAWLQTRLAGGTFVLRMEDLDKPRTRPGSAERILDDLRWLGLDWDEGPDCEGPVAPYTQSSRQPLYAAALEHLCAANHVYPCFCSRKDMARAASAPHADDDSLIYPGTCRELTPQEQQLQKAQHPQRRPAWRFRVNSTDVEFADILAGRYAQHLPRDVGDFVLQRSDKLYAYQLAVVVDDWLMGISDVVRGADLLSSTPRQIVLFRELGASRLPQYWHVPLLRDAAGNRISKRDGTAASISTLRAGGATPARVVGQLAQSVNLVPTGSVLSTRELLQDLNLERFRNALRKAFETEHAKADTGGSPYSSSTYAE